MGWMLLDCLYFFFLSFYFEVFLIWPSGLFVIGFHSPRPLTIAILLHLMFISFLEWSYLRAKLRNVKFNKGNLRELCSLLNLNILKFKLRRRVQCDLSKNVLKCNSVKI